ncbi:hypothetical protein [Agrobacterium rubi]|uniref:Uncharacterized protein n=1 Tax=Agrobacterium rubi TaxID=28099 RepID=A0AAE7UQ10_9HYPH|nr:hypothetical protein [Agrobacterium rubi]NTE87081.1 hypothetical protein [Agrobacterium rubi]NTF03015.1 hypothetical protein [Agrobacterium rubi]NTF37259.1 hypothetical protein [Agrobacterium rubi]OCJ55175.1 hypothetical protein A6U92_00715 [Agrobacterium rubi]QTF99680.1 hypothetical protein G6M88_04355 [Agrobacterium rubi]
MTSKDGTRDPLTAATITVAWVIILNKPFYPLSIWWLVGNGVEASLISVASMLFFLAIPLIARRSALAARVALPLIGTIDTIFETKLFGTGAGTELFFAACIMLVALSFRANEKLWQIGMTGVVFAGFLFTRYLIGDALHIWSAPDLAKLFNLNAFAVACLTAFIALRYAGLDRGDHSSGARPS